MSHEKRRLIRFLRFKKDFSIGDIVDMVKVPNGEVLKILQATKATVRHATRRAILRGVLKRLPCNECGAVDAEAHHNDYFEPLDVVWLCRSHHLELHNSIAKGCDGLSTSVVEKKLKK